MPTETQTDSTIANTDTKTGPKRLIATLQSKGALGKSYFLALLMEYYEYAGIPYKAIDCDVVHQTLRRRYSIGLFDGALNQDNFGQLLAALPDSPAVLWDFRANFTPDFLRYALHYQLPAILERRGFRATLPIFMSDDEDARRSAADLAEYFGEAADYLLVDNPKVFSSTEFRRTGLYRWLQERATPTIEIPAMGIVTKNYWEELEDHAGAHLSMSKVIDTNDCLDVAQLELSGTKDMMFRQFEDSAKLLIPDPGAIKEKVTRGSDFFTPAPARFKSPFASKS
jgi:hypothetical protein